MINAKSSVIQIVKNLEANRKKAKKQNEPTTTAKNTKPTTATKSKANKPKQKKPNQPAITRDRILLNTLKKSKLSLIFSVGCFLFGWGFFVVIVGWLVVFSQFLGSPFSH